MISAFNYNFTNSFKFAIWLDETKWHQLNNILSTTYLCLLLIHLTAIDNKVLGMHGDPIVH
jgi:hypothetical protein